MYAPVHTFECEMIRHEVRFKIQEDLFILREVDVKQLQYKDGKVKLSKVKYYRVK